MPHPLEPIQRGINKISNNKCTAMPVFGGWADCYSGGSNVCFHFALLRKHQKIDGGDHDGGANMILVVLLLAAGRPFAA
jgi:hypothetical protein